MAQWRVPPLILLSFSVCFACCILQFWYLKKVRDALIDRHPEAYLAAEKSSIFPMQEVWKFVRGSRYKKLNDDVLNRHVRNLKRLMIIAYGAWAVYGICVFTSPFNEPKKLSLSLANGSYSNNCCGTLALNNGRMIFGKWQISYVVESDKERPYVLPAFYVGASSRGFVVREKGFPLKLYFNDPVRSREIELVNDGDGSVFTFQRLRDK